MLEKLTHATIWVHDQDEALDSIGEVRNGSA